MDTVLRDQETPDGQNIAESSPSKTNSLTRSKSDKHILVLDGIRAVACIIVFSTHLNLFARHHDTWPALHNTGKLNVLFALSEYLGDYFGASGVILFFILSSFLLFLPYAKSLLFDSPWPSLRRFYLRRFFRILPGYYVALLLIALFFHPEFLRFNHWHDLWLFLTFRMDYNLSGALNIPFWTLAVEFQFYLILPIIAWLFKPLVRHGTIGWRLAKLTLCLLVVTAWGLLTRDWGLYIADTPKLDFLIPHAVSTTLKAYLYGDTGKYLEVFAVGMLICMVYTYTQTSSSGEHWGIRMRRLSWPMFITGLALLSFLSFWNFYFVSINSHYREFHFAIRTSFDSYASILFSYWLEWEALTYAIAYGFCLWALLYASAKLKRAFESSPLRWIASISFSLYMWHFNFMGLFATALLVNIQREGWSPFIQYGTFWCWTLFVIIPISAMLYRWVEQPGMRLGEWLIRKLER